MLKIYRNLKIGTSFDEISPNALVNEIAQGGLKHQFGQSNGIAQS